MRPSFFVVLVALVALALGADDGVASVATQEVWLSHPVLVTDNKAVRIDIGTRTLLHRARVTQVVACSAIDVPFVEYAERSERTGCSSPGYASAVIYSEHGQSEVNKFLVRQTAQSLYVRRRLLNRHAPVVYLEIHVRLVNEVGGSQTDHVFVTRFAYPERAVPIGGSSATDSKDEAGRMEDPENEDELLEDHSPSRNASGHHWGEFAGLVGGVFAALGILALITYSRRHELAKRRMDWNRRADYGERRHRNESDTVMGWIQASYRAGIICKEPGRKFVP